MSDATAERMSLRLTALAGQIGGLVEVAEAQAARIQQLEEIVLAWGDPTAPASSSDTAPATPSPWPPFDTRDEWVDRWLIPTFQLTTVLDNWRHRPAYVTELDAAYLGYQHLTVKPGNARPGMDAMVWHSYMHGALERIKGYYRTPNIASATALTALAARPAAPQETGAVREHGLSHRPSQDIDLFTKPTDRGSHLS